MLDTAQQLVVAGVFSGHGMEIKTVVASFLVGIVVGITGMGGGALMTPALIFLGVGNATSVVTADLAASAVSRTSGAAVHWRQGSPNLKLAGLLIVGSVPMAFVGPYLLRWASPGDNVDNLLKVCIGFALLFAASTYAVRLYIQLRESVGNNPPAEGEPVIRPIATVLIGMLGGLLVGVTSVGAGSVIMIAMLMLYPALSAVKLVGTDLVQAVPLVLAAAAANI
ncbi:MAG: sulfite exporter TauE/SafE family protein, partial [Nocardioidaceae bacterium]